LRWLLELLGHDVSDQTGYPEVYVQYALEKAFQLHTHSKPPMPGRDYATLLLSIFGMLVKSDLSRLRQLTPVVKKFFTENAEIMKRETEARLRP